MFRTFWSAKVLKRRASSGEANVKTRAANIAKTAACAVFTLILGLGILSAYWACAYRLPRGEPIAVDVRTRSGGRTLLLCAGLANNPHGFPGHCYIVWDRSAPERLQYAESDGFCPASVGELLPSLYADVHGIMADHAVVGNTRSFDYIVVRLDEETYTKARSVRRRFESDPTFHTGVRDCVTYVDEIAGIAGLKRPARCFVYPLDYLERLKRLNRSDLSVAAQE